MLKYFYKINGQKRTFTIEKDKNMCYNNKKENTRCNNEWRRL